MARYGGSREDWIDLSTGINPAPYPVPEIPLTAWGALPTRSEMDGLAKLAQRAFDTTAACLPTAGAQAAIQMIPRVLPSGRARVLGPTYNEHAASLTSAGWTVDEVDQLDALASADLAVVVNPNNPDGRCYHPDQLITLANTVGHLIVDESFGDPQPELSLGPALSSNGNITVLRSFGKFYGLAGMRLGFVLGADRLIGDLKDLSGPWPVNGAAIFTGAQAMADEVWKRQTIARLNDDAAHLDRLARQAGWRVVGGTPLFRLYDTPDANAAQDQLARHRIWSRVFPYSNSWIRLGLTHGKNNWHRLEVALSGQ